MTSTTSASQPGSNAAFLPALTGIRAFAAFWVVGYHLIPVLEALIPPQLMAIYSAVMSTGYLGVDLFFILSGFILSLNYGQRFAERVSAQQDVVRFLAARLARIYPVHLFTLLLLIPAIYFMQKLGLDLDPVRFSPQAFVENLLLTQGWHLNLYDRLTWNTPAWSISMEWLAYLAFPLLATIIFRRAGRITGWGQLLLLSSLLPLTMFLAGRLFGFGAFDPFIRIGIGFITGMLLYDFYRHHESTGVDWGRVTLGAVAAVLVGSALWYATGYDNFAYALVTLFPVIILGLAHPGHPLYRLMASRPAIYLGLISYSLYMTHNLWLMVAKALLPAQNFAAAGMLNKVMLISAYFLPCLLIAALTFHIIEEPSRKLINRRLRRA